VWGLLTFFLSNFLFDPPDDFLGLSSENSYFYNLAGLNGLQRGERLRNLQPNVIEIIRRRTDNQNCDISAGDVLLMPDVLIYGDQDFKLFFRQPNQLAIFFAAESRVSNRLALVPSLRKKELRPPWQALVKQQSHFRVAVKLILASSRAAIASARVTLGKSSRNSLRLRSCSR